jgi:hypothetical protein
MLDARVKPAHDDRVVQIDRERLWPAIGRIVRSASFGPVMISSLHSPLGRTRHASSNERHGNPA